MSVNDVSSAYQSTVDSTAGNGAKNKAEGANGKKEVKGAGTYGKPELSQKALDYYNGLKKKYGNLNFVLVSSDKKAEAEAMKGSFAKGGALTVLIDTDKIEQMAEDETYRKKIEATISNAASQIAGLSEGIGSTNSNVTAYGMTIDKNGTASFFAVVDKSLAAQRDRMEKRAEEKKEEKRADAKKANAKRMKEKADDKQLEGSRDSDKVIITANSAEELLQKIKDYEMGLLSNHVKTDTEKSLGNSIDYSV